MIDVVGAYSEKAIGQRRIIKESPMMYVMENARSISPTFFSLLRSLMMLLTLMLMFWRSFAIRCSVIVCGPRMITNLSDSGMVRTYVLSTASTMTLIWG